MVSFNTRTTSRFKRNVQFNFLIKFTPVKLNLALDHCEIHKWSPAKLLGAYSNETWLKIAGIIQKISFGVHNFVYFNQIFTVFTSYS